MKLELSFLELHTPLFLGGVNWGLKLLQKSAKGQIEMTYDRDYGEVLIKYKNSIAIIPCSNVVSMNPIATSLELNEIPTIAIEGKAQGPSHGTPTKRGRPSQASSPMDHVHAGEGAGKVHD